MPIVRMPLRRPAGAPAQAAALALAVVLATALLLLSEALRLTATPLLSIPLFDRRVTPLLLSGFHAGERDARGRYRWTMGDARVSLPWPGLGRATALELRIGPAVPGHPPPSLALSYSGRAAATLTIDERPRRYQALIPPAAPWLASLTVDLRSDSRVIPPDNRPVGLRVEGVSLRTLGAALAWPAPAHVALQALVLALGAVIVHQLRVPPALAAGTIALAAAGIALLGHAQPLVLPMYLARLVVALALLAALSRAVLPHAARSWRWLGPPALVRALWGATLLACLVRLAGALFPPFAAYDLELNVGRLLKVAAGTLVVTNESFEFGGGVTVYPPGPYLMFLPGLLAGLTPKLLIQGSIALWDGMGALATAALARTLGAGGRVALFSALIYATVPIGLTSLFLGHTAQVFGQGLMAPLAVALLLALRRPDYRLWLAAGTLLSVALLSHIGVAILALAWLGLAWLALAPLGRSSVGGAAAATWRQLTLVLAISAAIGFSFAYAPVVLLHIEELGKVSARVASDAVQPAYNLIAKAFWIAYYPLGLLLIGGGLALAPIRRLPPGGAALAGAWLGAVALFWMVEMATGLQVRYLVFLTPLACLLIALLLDRLASHGRAARALAWATMLLLVIEGGLYWYGGVFGTAPMSMVPLLR